MSAIKMFSSGVASQVATDQQEVQGIAEWIALILPLISQLPCFKPKTPSEKRAWIEAHPNTARAQAVQALKAKSTEKLKRRELRPIADRAIEEALSMSDEDFARLSAGQRRDGPGQRPGPPTRWK